MRLAFAFFIPFMAFAQSSGLAQRSPAIGVIDIYGARKTSPAEIRKVLGLTEGARLSGSKSGLEERIEDISGVVAARIEAACCQDGKVILYVGIQEKGAPTFEYHTPPAEDLSLPEEVVNAYGNFLGAVRQGGMAGQPAEDLTNGHSLMSDPAVREIQLGFVSLANTHLAQLRSVIRQSQDAEHRAMAAYII